MSGKLVLKLLLTLTVSLAVSPNLAAQQCSPPAITANSKIYNIFSPDQEMILGDLTAQRMAGERRFLRDDQLEAYLNARGQKLVKHLPETGLKFQFHLVDIP